FLFCLFKVRLIIFCTPLALLSPKPAKAFSPIQQESRTVGAALAFGGEVLLALVRLVRLVQRASQAAARPIVPGSSGDRLIQQAQRFFMIGPLPRQLGQPDQRIGIARIKADGLLVADGGSLMAVEIAQHVTSLDPHTRLVGPLLGVSVDHGERLFGPAEIDQRVGEPLPGPGVAGVAVAGAAELFGGLVEAAEARQHLTALNVAASVPGFDGDRLASLGQRRVVAMHVSERFAPTAPGPGIMRVEAGGTAEFVDGGLRLVLLAQRLAPTDIRAGLIAIDLQNLFTLLNCLVVASRQPQAFSLPVQGTRMKRIAFNRFFVLLQRLFILPPALQQES